MADLILLAITIAFFALCTGLVAACDRLIGPDEQPVVEAQEAEDRVAVGAR